MGGEKKQANGEVSSEHGSAATGDSGRGPSEDGAAPATDDGNLGRQFDNQVDNSVMSISNLRLDLNNGRVVCVYLICNNRFDLKRMI